MKNDSVELNPNIDQIFEEYISACESEDGAIKCGDLVRHLDDDTCKILYERLSNDSRSNKKLVRCLWINYDNNRMRWE